MENCIFFVNFLFQVMKPHISRVTALFLLCHVFLILTHAPLVRLLAWIIFSGDSEIFTERGAAKLSLYTSSKVVSKVLSFPRGCYWVKV